MATATEGQLLYTPASLAIIDAIKTLVGAYLDRRVKEDVLVRGKEIVDVEDVLECADEILAVIKAGAIAPEAVN